MRAIVAAGLVLATVSGGTAQAGDHAGALLGGFAAGAVGGALLGAAISQPRPAPVYAPAPVYVAPPPPAPVYARRVTVVDSYDRQVSDLHELCDEGDRHACIRFGILIGRHRERVAEWRRLHPDYLFD